MTKKLYVGNLPFETNDSSLQGIFTTYGSVQSAQVIMDQYSGRSKGFGFVEMGSAQEGQAAIDGLNGKDSGGRELTVSEARPRKEHGDSGGGTRGYGGGR